MAKTDSTVDIALLEHCVREDLNKRAPRVMAVLDPLKVVIDELSRGPDRGAGRGQQPGGPRRRHAQGPFSRELYIEQEDFMEEPPKKFFRLAPGREVRLRYAYFITCTEVVKDAAGKVVELRCTYDPATRGGDAPDGRKVKATMHWVSAAHALPAEARLYDHLMGEDAGLETVMDDEVAEAQESEVDVSARLNPNSLQVLTGCFVEPSLAGAAPLARTSSSGSATSAWTWNGGPGERRGGRGRLVFNRTVTLKDRWAKAQKAEGKDG